MKDLFNINNLNKLKPEKGRLLISEPFMEDNFFKRSVIYLCEHNEDGSFGFVLNNTLSIQLHDVVDGFIENDFNVGFGGPVNSNNLYYIHCIDEMLEDSIKIVDNLYTGGDFETLQKIINAGIVDNDKVRFFLGYSGWTSGQLDKEIEDNAWIVAELTDKSMLRCTDKELWKNILDDMGGKFKVIANFPKNPSLN